MMSSHYLVNLITSNTIFAKAITLDVVALGIPVLEADGEALTKIQTLAFHQSYQLLPRRKGVLQKKFLIYIVASCGFF